MCCSQELPKGDPRIIAWEKFKQSREYTNAHRWIPIGGQYIDGALWAAFLTGYEVAKLSEPSETSEI